MLLMCIVLMNDQCVDGCSVVYECLADYQSSVCLMIIQCNGFVMCRLKLRQRKFGQRP